MKTFCVMDPFYIYFVPLVKMHGIFCMSHARQSYLLLFLYFSFTEASLFTLRSLFSFFVSLLPGWNKPYQLGTTAKPFCYTVNYIKKVGIFSLQDFMEQRCVGRRAMTPVCECREEFTQLLRRAGALNTVWVVNLQKFVLFSAQTSVKRMTASPPWL